MVGQLLGPGTDGAGSTTTVAGGRLVSCPPWPQKVPVALLTGLSLRANLAVVLAEEIRAGAGPGAVYLAMAGTCLVLEAVDDNGVLAGLATDDRLLEPGIEAELSLHAYPLGGAPLEARAWPATCDSRVEYVRGLADAVGRLAPGQLVLPLTERADPALPPVPGLWEIRGPDGAMLVVNVEPGGEKP